MSTTSLVYKHQRASLIGCLGNDSKWSHKVCSCTDVAMTKLQQPGQLSLVPCRYQSHRLSWDQIAVVAGFTRLGYVGGILCQNCGICADVAVRLTPNNALLQTPRGGGARDPPASSFSSASYRESWYALHDKQGSLAAHTMPFHHLHSHPAERLKSSACICQDLAL